MENYRLTKEADKDLVDIYEYGIFNFGLKKAQTYLLGLHQCFQSLADVPSVGRSADELASKLRRFEYQSHVVFYQVECDGVLIVRVLRSEMDFKRHF